jgi:hypothetical protein
MTGYQLKEGTCDKRPLTDDEIWNGIWNYLGSGTMKQASYIFSFFNAILDSLDDMDGRGRISYDRLFDSFAESYWILVFRYGIEQRPVQGNAESSVRLGILSAAERCGIHSYVPYRLLSPEVRRELAEEMKARTRLYAAGTLFEATGQILYSFNSQEEWIEMNPEALPFLRENRRKLRSLNFDAWAAYLARIDGKKTREKTAETLCQELQHDGDKLYKTIFFLNFPKN